MKASKLSLLALSVTLAMILSFVESQIPALVAIPGVKVGLANIVVVFALYKLGWKEAAVISLTRVFLVGLLFGNGVSILYSVVGATVSFAAMMLLKHTKVFSYKDLPLPTKSSKCLKKMPKCLTSGVREWYLCIVNRKTIQPKN